jgi:hypothetical protein
VVFRHSNERLIDDVDVVQSNKKARTGALGNCQKRLFAQSEKDEPMPDACEDMCYGKGTSKGKPLRVPRVGEKDGPKWAIGGWAFGYKLWVGDLPSDVTKVTIGQYCKDFADISVQCHRTQSGMAYAIITFKELAPAMEAFEKLAKAKFDHDGQMHWPTVKCLRGLR